MSFEIEFPRLPPGVLLIGAGVVLQGWARRCKTSQPLALRSRIVLACADDASVTAVAAGLGISRDTVREWRSRFQAARLLPADQRLRTLAGFARSLSNRPRMTLGYMNPSEQLAELLAHTG